MRSTPVSACSGTGDDVLHGSAGSGVDEQAADVTPAASFRPVRHELRARLDRQRLTGGSQVNEKP
ncbi:MAG: hypothetical protein QOK16_2410 [Solirubrobacteraceae bacterium]|jgi:hypothetical protein|nr:hypothetical protein [Solirubrobacteraceae bacterium]